VGTLLTLVGARIIPVKEGSVHAPWSLLSAIGVAFALGGVAVWSMAARQYRSNRRQFEARRFYRGNPAMTDYAWDPAGYSAPRWARAVRGVVAAIGVSLFLSIFNYWAFWGEGGRFVQIITLLFDLIGLAVWWGAVVQVVRAAKFGGSRVVGAEFPCHQRKPMRLRWQPASGIVQVNQGTFTLRCVEEWFESRGSGDTRSTTLVQEELWSATRQVEGVQHLARGGEIELNFEVPGDLPSTRLSAARPVFWELEVKLDLPGLDFEEIYLVPVY
jgi:hypothetical protein